MAPHVRFIRESQQEKICTSEGSAPHNKERTAMPATNTNKASTTTCGSTYVIPTPENKKEVNNAFSSCPWTPYGKTQTSSSIHHKELFRGSDVPRVSQVALKIFQLCIRRNPFKDLRMNPSKLVYTFEPELYLSAPATALFLRVSLHQRWKWCGPLQARSTYLRVRKPQACLLFSHAVSVRNLGRCPEISWTAGVCWARKLRPLRPCPSR